MNNQPYMNRILCILCCAFTATMIGQFEQRSTLGVSGSSSKITFGDATYYISASVGQQSVIGTIGNDTYTMRQGFQQPPIRVVTSPVDETGLLARIYPNPVGSFVTVSFGTAIRGDIQSILYDIQGRDIVTMTLAPTQSFQVDMSPLAAGTYILNIRVGSEDLTTRLIKN
jgi:hypothetical protein